MTDIAATKARLLAKHIKKAVDEHDRMNPLDLTPILEYLYKRLEYAKSLVPQNVVSARGMESAIENLKHKAAIEHLIERVNVFQNPKHPGPPMNIHILTIYLFPDLFEYGLKYDPTTDYGVGPMYDAIGKVLCNWSGHEYYGN